MVLSKITSAIAMLLFSQEADGRMNVKDNLSKAQSLAHQKARRGGNRAMTAQKARSASMANDLEMPSHPKRPIVEADTSLLYDYCTLAGDRLEDGPEPFDQYTSSNGAVYTDYTFYDREQLYWPGHSTLQDTWDSWFDADWNEFQRIVDFDFVKANTTSVSPTLFDSDGPHFNDIEQGGAGTCYVLASMSALAEFPDLVEDVFILGDELNDNGIYGLKFFVRGKPWVVSVDDLFFVDTYYSEDTLMFLQPDPYSGAMWGPLLEKGWAKVAGNYELSDGGYLENGIRLFTGAPVFTYWSDEYYTQADADSVWAILSEADDADYIMGASVYTTVSGETTNACGIVQGHAYSILSAFTMTDADGEDYNMLLIRNPWGITYYSKAWNKDDTNWTDALVAQVPLGVDPRTDSEDGLFVIPTSNLQGDDQCISSIQVGHYRDDEGYTSIWFDEEAVTSDAIDYTYFVTAPTGSNDDSYLYFTTESFYQAYIPIDCMDPDSTGIPLTYIYVTNMRTNENWYQYYYEVYHNPIIVGPDSYEAGDEFSIYVYYQWAGSPTRDFTTTLYAKNDANTWILNSEGYANQMNMDGSEPSGFYWSDWRTGVEHDHPNEPLRGWYFVEGEDSEDQWYDPSDEYYCYDETYEYYYTCNEEEFMEEYWEEEEDDGWTWGNDDDEEEFEDASWYQCYDEYTGSTYTCDRDAYMAQVEITCLQDVWIASDTISHFWQLVFMYPWVLFIWF